MKKFILLLVAVSMCFSLNAYVCAESSLDDGYNIVVFEENFDTDTDFAASSFLASNAGAELVAENSGNKYAEFILTDAAKRGHITNKSEGEMADTTSYLYAKIEAKVKLSKKKSNVQIAAYNGATSTRSAIINFNSDGSIKAQGGSSTVSYNAEEWVNIVIYLNLKEGKFTAYAKNTLLGENLAIPNAANMKKFTQIRFLLNQGQDASYVNDCKVAIDDVKYTISKLDYTTSIENGSKNVSVKDSIEIDFSLALNEAFTPSLITVTKNDSTEPDSNATVTKTGDKKALITFSPSMDFGATYTVTLSGNIKATNNVSLIEDKTFTYETQQEGMTATMPIFKDGNDVTITSLPQSGKIKASVTIYNLSDLADKKAQLYIGVYGKDDEGNEKALEEFAFSPIEAVSAAEPKTLIAEINLTSYEDRYVKAFIVDENMNLLRNDFAYLGGQETQKAIYKTNGEIDNSFKTEPSLNGDMINLSAELSDKKGGIILVLLKKGEGETVLIEPIYTDEKGQASFEHKVTVGYYSVIVSGSTSNKKLQKDILYLTDSAKQAIIDDINSAQTLDEFKQKTEGYITSKMLIIESEHRTENSYQISFERRAANTTYDAFIAQMKLAEPLRAKINAADWEALYNLLINSGEVILNNTLAENEDYDIFSSKGEEEQKEIAKAVVRPEPFESFLQFRTAFSNALISYTPPAQPEEDETDTTIPEQVPLIPPSNSDGGGGGGGGAKPQKPEKEPLPQIKEEDTTISEENTQTVIFSDLQQAEWAQESILALYDAGIISEAADKCYRPLDNITREEFVKLLAVLLGLKTDDAESCFVDAKENSWYIPYLSAAKKAGIVNGRANNTFGIGECITRQDMAVMAYRAVSVSEKKLEKKQEKIFFSDNDNISTYAIEAIESMQESGIINGMGDGNFAPFDNANRAQAATIIYKIMAELEGGAQN